MTTHPNRNWKRRWTVDLAARTATHQDGWVFLFAAVPGEDGGIDGECLQHPALAGLNLQQLSRTASRIAREAREIYVDAMRRARAS